MKRRRCNTMTPSSTSLLILVFLVTTLNGSTTIAQSTEEQQSSDGVVTDGSLSTPSIPRGVLKIGDRCENVSECGFDGAVCSGDKKITCQCSPDLPASNHIDKCGKTAMVNESCFFNEQCEMENYQTECKEGHCACRFEKTPVAKDGKIECVDGAPSMMDS